MDNAKLELLKTELVEGFNKYLYDNLDVSSIFKKIRNYIR